jgi:hypothetical protein
MAGGLKKNEFSFLHPSGILTRHLVAKIGKYPEVPYFQNSGTENKMEFV